MCQKVYSPFLGKCSDVSIEEDVVNRKIQGSKKRNVSHFQSSLHIKLTASEILDYSKIFVRIKRFFIMFSSEFILYVCILKKNKLKKHKKFLLFFIIKSTICIAYFIIILLNYSYLNTLVGNV